MASSVTPEGVDEAFIDFTSSSFALTGNENADRESDSWGVAFPGPSAQACLLVRARIGAGAFSAAQLVQNREDPTVLIVRKYRRKAYGLMDVDSRLENEVRIALTLEERMRNIKGPRPLMAEMLHSHDIRPADVNFWTRVSFWKYYNLGDFSKFYSSYPATAANPSVLPVAIFARFLHQMLSSIQWLMDQGVFHRDLAFRNIFVNWEEGEEAPNFFVGDFGCATLSSDPKEPTFEQYQQMSPGAKAQHTVPYILRNRDTPGRRRNREHWDLDLLLNGIYDGTSTAQGPNSILTRYANARRAVALPPPLTALLTALNAANQQDRLDRVMPKRARPALQSLRAHIATAFTVEETATAADANRATWRAVWTPILAARPPLEPKSWPSASIARRAIEAGALPEDWGAGATAADVIVIKAPYRIVDLNAEEEEMDDAVANFDAEIKTRNIDQANNPVNPDNDWSTPPSITPGGWNNAMPGNGFGGFNGNVNGPFGTWNFWGQQVGFAPARGAGQRGGGGGGGGGPGVGPLAWTPLRQQSPGPLGRTPGRPGSSPGRIGPQSFESPAMRAARLRRERSAQAALARGEV